MSYAAGWNLVGGAAGTTFAVSLFAWNSTGVRYDVLSPGTSVTSAQGYWAYFNAPTTVTITTLETALALVTVPLASGQWTQIADPAAIDVEVTGVDQMYTYDSVSGRYQTATVLKPGEGTWVFSANGGTAQLLGARLQGGAPSR